jgi:hypothetical protein
MRLVPAPLKRDWMGSFHGRTAYHCLPLVIANQAGWFILTTHSLTVRWTGGDDLDALKIFYLTGDEPYPGVSMFGDGILTFHIPFLFRTPPGYNLLVRGPANCPKDGIHPLEGLVETDWAVATFTMNWQMTRADHTVTFEENEPIAMIVPQRRGDLERFRPTAEVIEGDPETARRCIAWAQSRREFIGLKRMCPADAFVGWQEHYLRGTGVDGVKAPEHQTALHLHPFQGMDAKEDQKG